MKIFGKNPCLEILKTDAQVEEIFLFDKIEENFKQEVIKLAKNAQIKYCNKDLLNKMCDFKNHQGIVMFCENYHYYDLDDILKERNMTSKELCKKVHITEANLSILRSGKAKGVRFSTINKICYYLECDVGDILKFDGRLEEEDE